MQKKARWIIIVLIVLMIGALAAYFLRKEIAQQAFTPTKTSVSQGVGAQKVLVPEEIAAGGTGQQEKSIPAPEVEIVAENLQIPWEIAFLPEGDFLITERPGTLKRIGKNGLVISIEGVVHRGEGGLLGMTLHPRFHENQYLYLYFTTRAMSGLQNRIERYRLEGAALTDRTMIIDRIPGAPNHDGGRIAFGPDGLLYVTTGDAQNSALAQDKNSLAGKILRVRDDGSIPSDNPFGNAVYSYGHRNVQGIAWDDTGRLWATEHGRSGVLSGYDELNFIEKGKNYGWPDIQGDEQKEGMIAPIINSGAKETWAPAGAAYYKGSIFFGGLRGEALYEARLEGEKVKDLKMHFRQQYGRIRAVVIGPDGFLYLTTSNTDGRGKPKPGDDKIVKINPVVFRR